MPSMIVAEAHDNIANAHTITALMLIKHHITAAEMTIKIVWLF